VKGKRSVPVQDISFNQVLWFFLHFKERTPPSYPTHTKYPRSERKRKREGEKKFRGKRDEIEDEWAIRDCLLYR
jgi:hypothetical protein